VQCGKKAAVVTIGIGRRIGVSRRGESHHGEDAQER
jgi:hypothetical protein